MHSDYFFGKGKSPKRELRIRRSNINNSLATKTLNSCRFHNEGGASAYQSFPVCQGKELTCSNNILNRMGEFNTVINTMTNKTTPCLTNCEDQNNELFVTTSNYPNKKTFKEREEFCLLVKKLIK